MITAQILAIVALLLAFGVDQPTVNNVQAILENANKTQQILTIESPSGGLGSPAIPSASTTLDCTPVLEAKVVKVAGEVATGVDFMFMGTSTLPVGCSYSTSLPSNLQTPTLKYEGTIGSWLSNHAKLNGNVYTYWQGWGTGPDIVPSGEFTWSVGSKTKTISL